MVLQKKKNLKKNSSKLLPTETRLFAFHNKLVSFNSLSPAVLWWWWPCLGMSKEGADFLSIFRRLFSFFSTHCQWEVPSAEEEKKSPKFMLDVTHARFEHPTKKSVFFPGRPCLVVMAFFFVGFELRSHLFEK